MSAYRVRDSQTLIQHFVAVPKGVVFFFDDSGFSSIRKPQQLKAVMKAFREHGYQCASIGVAKLGDICTKHNIRSNEGAIIYSRGKYIMHVERLDSTIVSAVVNRKPDELPAAACHKPDDIDYARPVHKPPAPLPQYQYQKPDEATPAYNPQKSNEYQGYKPPPFPDLNYRFTKQLPKLPPGAQVQKPNEY